MGQIWTEITCGGGSVLRGNQHTADDVVHLDLEAIHRCDIVFAITDGIDAGTLYEVGYARAIGKPVVVLCERESEESMKMAQGSGCIVCRDFTTALYNTLWEAARA